MRWVVATIGGILGIPAGAVIGGIPLLIIVAEANKTLAVPSLDAYIGLSTVMRLGVLVAFTTITLGGGVSGGILGYRFGARLSSKNSRKLLFKHHR